MKIKAIIYLIIGIVFFTSCEDIVDVKLSDEDLDLYAIEAKVTTDDNPFVYLYKSLKVNSSEPYQGVSGAQVVIYDDSEPPQSVTLKENSDTPGLYLPEDGTFFIGRPGKSYNLQINDGDIEINGRDTLTRVEPIDSIQVRASLRGDKRFLGIFTYGPETPGLGNYYKWDIYINNELLYQSEYLVIASDELVDGNYISGFEIFTDFHDPNKPEDRKITLGDTIMVKQTSISKFAYYFYYQMFNQGQTGGFFSVPPANVESNLTANDGKHVLGLFLTSDISTSNTVIVDQAIEDELVK